MSNGSKVEGTFNKQIFNMSLENDYEVNEEMEMERAAHDRIQSASKFSRFPHIGRSSRAVCLHVSS